MRADADTLRRALPAAMLALGLAACAPGTAPTDAAAAPAAAGPAAPRAGAAPAEASTATGRYEFAFLARDPGRVDARITDWVEDACGLLALARVDVMPLDDPQLRADLVIEFAADGAELQRWAKPYGAEILGLSGNRLVFGQGTSDARQAWWTDVRGGIGDAGGLAGGLGGDARAIDCPTLDAAAADTLQCYEITDQAGLRRRLAWEGACS